MTVTAQTIAEISDKIQEATKDNAEAKGAYDQVMGEIKKDFKCEDLEAAKEEISTIEKEIVSCDEELDEKMNKFKEEYQL